MSQPATPIHQPIRGTLHLTFPYMVYDISVPRLYTNQSEAPYSRYSIYGHTPKNSNSSHIGMPHIKRQFSRDIQTLHINAAPSSSYQTTRQQRHYLNHTYHITTYPLPIRTAPSAILNLPISMMAGSFLIISHLYVRYLQNGLSFLIISRAATSKMADPL